MIRLDEITQAVLENLSLQSVYALVLFPLVWGLVKCCRGRYPRWQHGLWILILFRLVLPPDLAVPWSAAHLIRSATAHMVSKPFLSFPHPPLIFQDHQKPLSASHPDAFMHDGQNASEKIPTIGSRPATAKSPTTLKRFYLIICCAYFIVAGLLLALFLQRRRRFRKIAKQGKTVLDSAVLDIVLTWRKRLHIRRMVEVKVTASDVPTFTMGLFQPVLVLSKNLISPAGSAALEPVLAHELVHVKRLDDLAIYLQELVRIVYFFHPLVWFVMPRLSWTREAVCDATVLSHGTLSPKTYGRQMLEFVRGKAFPSLYSQGLANFTSAARGVAFRLIHIQKEDNMESHPLKTYLIILFLGLFLLPIAPVESSSEGNTTEGRLESQVQDLNKEQTIDNALIQYILNCVPCENPEEVSRIIWGDLITKEIQEEDFSRLVAATDCDIVKNIGDGNKAYIFYLLSGSRQGLYRPNFHFIKRKNKLTLLFKSQNLSTYVTDRPKVNGRYEIEEGWRADLFGGINDNRVNLAWASKVWFWTGTQYLTAYTDYTIGDATESSILGLKREWEKDTRSLYEVAPRE